MTGTVTGTKEEEPELSHDALVANMEAKRREWATEDEDDDDDDDGDRMLQDAIDMAIQSGKGWSPGEKEDYMKMILSDDYIPPIFCSTPQELEQTGLAEAFSSLQYDEDPAITYQQCKQKATKAFMDGKQNQANNIQYYRDAINHYYEAVAWVSKIEPSEHRENNNTTKATRAATDKEDVATQNVGDATTTEETLKQKQREETFEVFTEHELDVIQSTLYSNSTLCHLLLKNWGHAKTDATKSVLFNPQNVKAYYRLAKATQMLKEYEACGTALETGLELDPTSTDLLKLQTLVDKKIKLARQQRQHRERLRSERKATIKAVWKHCSSEKIKLGRIALVASTSDELDYRADDLADDANEGDAAVYESRWHHHFPHTGCIPTIERQTWSWPCMFLYPSHNQSDFVKNFQEDELLAARMAELYPELGEGDIMRRETISTETAMHWDYNNEFVCSNLAVYFEIHTTTKVRGVTVPNNIRHPDSVEVLPDLASTMQYYESSRVLKGDEGSDMMKVVELVERKRLKKQRKKWKQHYKTLQCTPDLADCIRIHPAMTLSDVLTHPALLITNFIVTFIVIPETHPYHKVYLQEHNCVGILQPKVPPPE